MGSAADIRVLGIAGSLPAGPYNRALLGAARELAPDGMRIEELDLVRGK
jgi:NAD(P)H-dependent FMN reductase